MAKINQVLLKRKFRGCLTGSLIGDCFGAPFEGDTFTSGSKLVLQKYFDKLEGQYFKAPMKKYTEDTSMTKCVAQCLIDNPKKLEPTLLAKSLVKEYCRDPRRGYGDNLVDIFNKLRANKFADPFKPAQEPVHVTGSSDNGAAMRISPIALFYYNEYNTMIDTAKIASEITHTHKQGVTGGLLQCVAVHQSLTMDPTQKIDAIEYTNNLIKKMTEIETDEEGLGIGNALPFKGQLEVVKELLKNSSSANDEEVVNKLGHSLPALYSVPTAIYCFLRASSDIESIQTSNPFRRTLQYAISLGGDTDTIASMAGSIAGAYYGEEQISESMLKHCEAGELFVEIADSLYSIKCKY